ncbi:DNA topoisomerase [Vibrio sp. MACH09]|uniref:DNA topoisomerase III n=1 Tax=Vibrio sp. MACH09 TaxID=3025122 RepID=UPI002790BBD3|nr:DNA topoisomerase III [Vibrio sp. MACH09]GLO64013.1 DNA topoisomerase [Vibrio sp. MACH09]
MRLFLCEKPSQGRDLAAFLGCNEKLDGALRGGNDVVTWAIGHLLSQADPDVYDDKLKVWSMDALPIIPDVWKMVVPAEKKKQFNIIKKLLNEADEVVIATDADREGEVIAREILEYVNYQGQIHRLWLSALDDESIRKGFESLKTGSETESLYFAGLARGQADWLLGMNLTRLCSIIGQDAGYRGLMSVGRVQTPTLRLVVERDIAISCFVSKPFYDVVVNINDQFDAKWQVPDDISDESGRCLNREHTDRVIQQCQGQAACVTVFERKRQKVKHPQLFYLGYLQKKMSSKYGYTAQQTLDTAQSLYEKHKITTYPRSDGCYLPESQHSEVRHIVQTLSVIDECASWCGGVDLSIKSACWNDKKVAESSHHAIIPTSKKVDFQALSERERRVYLAIVQRYLAQFYPCAEDDATLVELQCDSHRFKVSGKVERVKGWRIVVKDEGDDKKEEKLALPVLSVGQTMMICRGTILTKKTTPPAHYSEGSLLDAMANIARNDNIPDQFKKILKETAGLGTQATRASILEALKKRGFIESRGKKLLSTESGKALIAALPDEISNPVMTAIWEQALDGIEKGTYSLSEFMSKQEGFVRTIVAKVKSGDMEIRLPEFVEPSFPCPLCKKRMYLRKGKTLFWACENKEQCGLILDNVRGKPAKFFPCSCHRGVLVRKKAKEKGRYWWGCSAWKSGCKIRCFDDKGKPGKEMKNER